MPKIPDVKPGDLVKVYSKIKEGDKERVTQFQGIVIQTRGSNESRTFTVRKISSGIGIERIFPLNSPMITKIEIMKKGKVRRAKLGYLKYRKGRKMKIKEAALKSEKGEEVVSEKPVVQKEIPPQEQQKQKKEEMSEEQTGESAPGQKAVETP